jgi:peptidoglycan/xylan/chitin deacetylase (PgdA/CDA1 family)
MALRRRGLLVLPVAAALTLSCGPGVQLSHSVVVGSSASVNGRVVPLEGLETVGAALFRTGTRIPSGRLLSVLRHRHLGSDQVPGQVLVNGVPRDVTSALHAGDRVVTVAGPDLVEGTRSTVVPVPLGTVAGLLVGGRPGSTREVRGVVSGEVVSSTPITRPVPGHLPSAGALALTFDDGPDPVWTPRVLHALARAHAHATFCLIGREAAKHPELVRAIVAGGHTLCNHTWDHDERLPHRNPAQVRSELTRAQQAITRASGGVAPKLFRAPGGAWSPAVEATARALGLTPLKWTVDPRDWARPGTGAVLAVALARLGTGGILLLHDGGGDRDQTLAALDQLLVRLPRLHHSFAVPQP